ncbi:glycosyltransferase family 2 protein [Pseudomonas extremorientalis]|uniref:Glycosyltransferase involved in cell wall bisynthesis n=1 Tax=Pseudomonas extremorientalis TaxID=169669 RepID=A0A1H0W0J7_9PSED|nr:glycosyltransferase family 2 protein [Pseudomonas extremorientalis]KAB0518348.1 glycosyltransferase [Pseudomonas extremorientalis]OIN11869.1 hypothetical protein BFN10_07155 [Pseudomonas extremorientalis]SDP84202.1 Glycosyltransferase involved in cell wall bisynthesis [Pseudomonas extremorientalis]
MSATVPGFERLEGGRRLVGGNPWILENAARITVITVVYNDVAHLQRTIDSVASQTYGNIEHIIIDGRSADGTLQIIECCQSVDYWLSESDSGIYDAMNKGIDCSTGEWINFMNSGDVFFNENVIGDIFFNNQHCSSELIYGDVEVDYGGFKKIRRAGAIERLKHGMQFSHQSLFAKRSVLLAFGLDSSYRTAADYNFVIASWVKNFRFEYVELVVSSISAGGVSDVKRLQSHYQRVDILSSHLKLTNVDKVWMYCQGLYIRGADSLKSVLPARLVDWIKRAK